MMAWDLLRGIAGREGFFIGGGTNHAAGAPHEHITLASIDVVARYCVVCRVQDWR